jgi:hypothetical protein
VGPRYSPGWRGQIRLNCFKNIQNFPNFDQSKFELPKLQKFGKKILGATGTFSIEPSLDSEWISNEKSEKSLGLEFNEI